MSIRVKLLVPLILLALCSLAALHFAVSASLMPEILEWGAALLLVLGSLAVVWVQGRQVARHFQVALDAVKAREADLRRSEERLAAVIDNSAEAVLSLDERGGVLSFNAAAERMFGVPAIEAIGSDVLAFVPSVDMGNTAPVEVEATRLDGSCFPAQVTCRTVEVEGARMVVTTIADLTSRKQAEERLKESEGRFRDLAESASDWFWETDTEFRLTFVSERIGSILGVKPSEAVGYTYFDLGLGDYDLGLAQSHAEDLDARRPFRDLIFHIGPEGGKDGKIVRISGMPFYDQDGAFIGYRGIGADITREARAEARARQAQQQLADAIEAINDGIVLFDDQDRLVLCNREYERVFGKISGGLSVGSHFHDMITSVPAQSAFDTEGMAYGDWVERRFELHRKGTGEPFVLRMVNGSWLLCREYRTADGGTVGVRTDITDLKRREQDLETLKSRYQLILDCAGDGIVGMGPDGGITFVNRMAAALLLQPTEALVGRAFSEVVGALPEDRALLADALARGVSERVDNALFHRPGAEPLPVEYLAASLIAEDAVVGAVVVFRDVTMRRQYERALADQHAELERLVEERTKAMKEAQNEALRASRLASVGQLAAGIAHEINTPIQYIGDNLTFIQGAAAEMIPLLGRARVMAGAIRDGGDAPALAEDFEKSFQGGNLDFLMEETPPAVAQSLEGVAQVARIVLSMKEFSHPGTTQKSEVDINRALESTLVVSRNTWKHSATVNSRLDPSLPLVHCHPGEMNQVFLNLIINAAHAIEASGKPLPGVITIETAVNADMVEIRVSDTGTGVPEVIRDRIFDPFFTTKEVGKGTGQGLAICYDVVVVKHGGQILVGGAEGEGATFTLRIPLYSGGDAPISA